MMKPVIWAIALVYFFLQSEEAAQMVQAGDLAGAEREYRAELREHPNDPRLNYNLGSVLLLQGKFLEARPFLEVAGTDTISAKAAANYNLGNTDIMPAFADSALQNRDMRLRRAIDSYKESLRANPSD